MAGVEAEKATLAGKLLQVQEQLQQSQVRATLVQAEAGEKSRVKISMKKMREWLLTFTQLLCRGCA